MTELAITSTDIQTEQDWEAHGYELVTRATSLAWDLGDWVNIAEARWGERYKRAAEITGMTEGTLRNYSSVARRFELSMRHDKLSFHHHALVAAIPEEACDQWLDLAETESWSLRDLANALRSVQQRPPGHPEVVVTVFKITVPQTHEERWRAAAEQRGLNIEDWLIAVADAAAA